MNVKSIEIYKDYTLCKLKGGIAFSDAGGWLDCVFDTVQTAKYFIDLKDKFVDNFYDVISNAQRKAIIESFGYVTIEIIDEFDTLPLTHITHIMNHKTDIPFILNKSTGEKQQYAGFTYTSVDGAYGYLGIDNEKVVFICPHPTGIQKIHLTNYEIQYEKIFKDETIKDETIVKPIFVIIEAGHEGIEKMLYASEDEDVVSKKIKALKTEVLEAKERMNKILAEHGSEDDSDFNNYYDRMLRKQEIEWEEYDNAKFKNPDSYCVQKWDGQSFSCACKEFGCELDKVWLM